MTEQYILESEWVQLVEAGTNTDDNFILENTGTVPILIAFGSTDAYHTIHPNGTAIRAGVAGEVHARSASGQIKATLVISGT